MSFEAAKESATGKKRVTHTLPAMKLTLCLVGELRSPSPGFPASHVSSFKNLYDEKYANCNLTFFRESQNAGRERFAKAP